MSLRKLTPVLFVDDIESTLPFWVDRLGFSKTMEVPEGDVPGFVGLQRDGIEVMLQSRASEKKDVANLADYSQPGGYGLFIEVDDLDAMEAKLDGVARVVPRRKTFYGADELILCSPGGHVVTLAQMGQSE